MTATKLPPEKRGGHGFVCVMRRGRVESGPFVCVRGEASDRSDKGGSLLRGVGGNRDRPPQVVHSCVCVSV